MTPDNTKKLIAYCSNYLSTLISFPNKTTPPIYLTFDEQHRLSARRYSYESAFYYQVFQWFIGLDNKRTTIIINGNTNIFLQYNWSNKELEDLRRYPIAFYMYEPLFLRHHKDGVYPFVQSKMSTLDNEKPVCQELHWVQDFIERYELQKDIRVYVCDYNLKLKDIYQHERLKFKIETFDIFLLATSSRLIIDNLSCHQVNVSLREIYPYPNLKKKALCLNFRWEAFRELVTIHLRSRNDYDDFSFSYFHHHEKAVFLEKLGFNPFEWPRGKVYQQTVNDMQAELPYTLEIHEPSRALHPIESPIPDFDGINNQKIYATDYYLYRDSFLSIVTESRCITSFPCISEKTLKPMLMKRPFVLLAGPYALKYLKELGFKTFSDFWDESYDLIEDHEERLLAVFKTIDSILDRPLDELKNILHQMETILHHNHVHASFGLPLYYKSKLERTLNQISNDSWISKLKKNFIK